MDAFPSRAAAKPRPADDGRSVAPAGSAPRRSRPRDGACCGPARRTYRSLRRDPLARDEGGRGRGAVDQQTVDAVDAQPTPVGGFRLEAGGIEAQRVCLRRLRAREDLLIAEE